MALAINIIDGCGFSNKTHCELLLKKSYVYFMVKAVYPAVQYQHYSFKSECAMVKRRLAYSFSVLKVSVP